MSNADRWTCQDMQRDLFAFMHDKLDDASQTRARLHLEGCASCRVDLGKWQAWTPGLAVEPPLSPHHARVLHAKILARATQAEPTRSVTALRLRWALVAASVVFGLGLLFVRDARDPHHFASQTVANRQRLILPERVSLSAEAAVQVFGPVHMQALTAVVAERAGEPDTLLLQQGSARFTVDALPPGQTFSVCTSSLCVRVIGTEFSVLHEEGSDLVRVAHGVVAVSRAEWLGQEIVLHAGEEYRVGVPPTVVAPAPVHDRLQSAKPASEACARFSRADLTRDLTLAEHCLAADDVEGWLELGDAYQRERRVELAEKAFRFALSHARDQSSLAATASLSLATLATQNHDEKAAEKWLRAALHRDPDGPQAHEVAWRLAQLQTKTRPWPAARATLTHLIERLAGSTRRAEAAFLLGSILDREMASPSDAVAYFRIVVAEPLAPMELKTRAETRLRELVP